MAVFIVSKIQILHQFTDHHLPPASSSKTQLKPVLNIQYGISFSPDLSWRDCVFSLTKQAFKKLCVEAPSETICRRIVRFCMEYFSHVWDSIHIAFLNGEIEGFSLKLSNLFLVVELLHHSHYYNIYFEISSCIPPPLKKTEPRRSTQSYHRKF